MVHPAPGHRCSLRLGRHRIASGRRYHPDHHCWRTGFVVMGGGVYFATMRAVCEDGSPSPGRPESRGVPLCPAWKSAGTNAAATTPKALPPRRCMVVGSLPVRLRAVLFIRFLPLHFPPQPALAAEWDRYRRPAPAGLRRLTAPPAQLSSSTCRGPWRPKRQLALPSWDRDGGRGCGGRARRRGRTRGSRRSPGRAVPCARKPSTLTHPGLPRPVAAQIVKRGLWGVDFGLTWRGSGVMWRT